MRPPHEPHYQKPEWDVQHHSMLHKQVPMSANGRAESTVTNAVMLQKRSEWTIHESGLLVVPPAAA